MPTPMLAPQPISHLSLDLDRTIQNDFLGVNGVYHGFAFMPEQNNKGMTDIDRKREFERVQRMGLNIARTWYRPNWACGSSLYNRCDYENDRMKAFYKWLQEMKNRNVDVALQAGWWFTTDTFYGHTQPDPNTDIERYVSWVSDSVHQIIDVHNFSNVKYLILFTEPAEYESGLVPSGYTQWQYYVKVVTALHQRLIADGRRQLVRLVGPNSGLENLTDALAELDSVIDVYSAHNYNLPGYDSWLASGKVMQDSIKASGKPFWIDEYGLQNEQLRERTSYGNYVAQAVAASINTGIQTSLLWLLFDQQYAALDDGQIFNDNVPNDSMYHGVHRWGTCKWPHDDVVNPTSARPHYYAVSLMSRYLGGRNGTRSLYSESADSDAFIAATAPGGSEYSILVINGVGSEKSISVRLNRPLRRSLYRYVYNPATIQTDPEARLIGYSAELHDVGDSFVDRLPGEAVVIYSTIRGEPLSPY